ncbi:energy transducer TonB [Methylobacter sp.]|uniref:energy transducer TonB n=1 Tax=Methylobacter sp. TaxID=2051955 RepID=UPI0011F4F8E4|nr:energy transducer TonB [Methylobacter sp.]TAK64953.1 MAG: energy transducer TonB [Methylobacter sp.]
MNRPLVAFDKFEPAIPDRKRADVVPINQDIGRLIESLSASPAAAALGNFRRSTDYRDSKAIDYLIIAVLSVLVHSIVVDHFKHASVEKEQLVEPVKPPSKVQISFVRPQPKPAVVQPPPPPKVVALKKPPKPKVQPKPAPKIEPPPVATSTTVQADAPVILVPAAPSAPKVEEKVTEPRAGAGYLNNPAPVYPEIAMDRGWEGKVLMKVHVLANGKPDNVSVINSSGKEVLDDEAVRTVKQWTFVPAMRGTTPIDGWVTVPISFNLQG